MKKNFDLKKLCVSVSIIFAASFIAALIPFTQNITQETFNIGYPVAFFSVRVSQNFVFSTHLNLLSMLIDIALAYALCCLCERFFRQA